MYDSSCFFWKEELAVSWYVFRSSQATRLRHLRAFFFPPPFIRLYVLKLPVLGNEYKLLSLSLGPGGFCWGFVWLVFLSGCFFLSKGNWLISSRSGICGIRGPFWFVAKAELKKKCYQLFACSKGQIHFIIYGQTDNVLKLKIWSYKKKYFKNLSL